LQHSDITDRLAEKLVSPRAPLDVPALTRSLARAPAIPALSFSPPEGFAYYGLNPLAYADVLDSVLDKISIHGRQIGVVGIRSIGTTLSAVVAAAARARVLEAHRITVRPAGHPYNRETRLSAQQLDFVSKLAAANALFLVVDEGPGLSGSSFLSVAEALVHAGVSQDGIMLVCGHQPDFDTLRTNDGPKRARHFRWVAVASEARRPAQAELFIGGGNWRKLMLSEEQIWPASWITFERLKYLSAAENPERRFFKFAGLGHYGEAVIERELTAAEAGFAASPQVEPYGFVSYPLFTARPMQAADISASVLTRLAEYCAFRADTFRCELANLDALRQMVEHNLGQLGFDSPVALNLERPVIADGQMQPREWALFPNGRMLKTDSGSHGDDHFFPGATDIAWDLAGAIVEWGMNAAQAEMFLETYRRAGNDDIRQRIDDFITAYTAFRCSYCLMAANAMQASEEQPRLEQSAAEYGEVLSSCVRPRSLITPAA
jgi:hypothetical protein